MKVSVKHSTQLICALLASLLVTVAIQATAAQKTTENKVVARVNQSPVYYSELAVLRDQAIERLKRAGYRHITPELESRTEKQELEQLINRELILQAASAKLDDKTFLEKVEQRLKTYDKPQLHNYSGSKKQLPVVRDPRMQEQLRKKATMEAYLESRGINELQVPEKNLKEFYDKNKQGLATPESIKASHILLTLTKKATPQEVEAADKKIQEISRELKQGGDFAELAKKHSNCVTAVDGGDLGFVNSGYFPANLNKIAFELKPGEISEPVRTQHGFQIVKVIEKKTSKIPDFEEVKSFISRYLIDDYRKSRINEIISELKNKAKIEIL